MDSNTSNSSIQRALANRWRVPTFVTPMWISQTGDLLTDWLIQTKYTIEEYTVGGWISCRDCSDIGTLIV